MPYLGPNLKYMKLLHPAEFLEKCEQVDKDRAKDYSSTKEMYEVQRMYVGDKIYRKVKCKPDPNCESSQLEKYEWVLETPDMEPLSKDEAKAKSMDGRHRTAVSDWDFPSKG